MEDVCPENYSSRVLVEIWTDFVNWEKRRKGENGFLLGQLEKFNCKKVFDSCLGDGADSIYLVKQGFDVTSNDVDELFIEKAKGHAEREKVNLKITKYDWRNLRPFFSPKSFDAVLCLGNSLSYLFKKQDRLKAVKNFRLLLRDGGILIIDERNYQYFLDRSEEIVKQGKFRYKEKYVYCGKKVCGRPVEISKDKVRMEYRHKGTGKKGYLVLHPFQRGELMQLLREAGFSRIENFSDFKRGFDPCADFYQYICVK